MKTGKLKIFFGYADGSGKTYTMLQAALRQKALGYEVVVGRLSPQARQETYMLAQDLEILSVERNSDLTAEVLRRNPQIVLIDDIGSRQPLVEELLTKGFDVYTTLNVFDIGRVRSKLNIPEELFSNPPVEDSLFLYGHQLEFIDIEPEELLERYASMSIYNDKELHLRQAPLFKDPTLRQLRKAALDFSSKHHDMRVLPTNEYLLVCVSPAGSSRRVIQIAARSAKTLNARLVALHVETRKPPAPHEKTRQQLRSNLYLAEQLGAEVVVIHGRNVATAVAEYASMRNIHRIAIGRGQRHRSVLRVVKPDLVQKVLQLNPRAEVQIIPGFPGDYEPGGSLQGEPPESGPLKNTAAKAHTNWFTYVKQLLLMGGATALAILFDILGLSEANIIMMFLLGVVLVSLSGGRWIGVSAAVVSVMLFNFLFTEPRYTFVVNDPQYLIIFPVLFTVALITSELVNRMKREAMAADIREQRTEVLYRISRSLLQATGTRAVIMAALEHLSGIFKVGMVVYLPDKDSGNLVSYHLGPDSQQAEHLESAPERQAAEWSFANAQAAGHGTVNYSRSQGIYYPIQTHNQVLGVLGVDAAHTSPDKSRNSMIEAVAAQIALAIDRENLAEAQEQSRIEIERERLRSNLLRAISHDLRSPLASISGSSSTLLYDWRQLNDESRSQLLTNIQQDADWLTQLIENLLSLAKVEGSHFVLNTESELADDIIAGVLSKVKSRAADHSISTDLPDEPLFIPADVGLVQQVLVNLIDNALRYTPPGCYILISVKKTEDSLIEFKVSDDGPGIPEEYREQIFDRFFTLKSNHDQRRGLGLGLSICKSIVEIHGGNIELNRTQSGGAEFRFTLPAKPTATGSYAN